MATLLILGGGELGAHLAATARRHHQHLHILVVADYDGAPALAFAHTGVVADLRDHDTLLDLLHKHAPTWVLPELEGISLGALHTWCHSLAHDPVIPSLHAVETTMDRWALHLAMQRLGAPMATRALVTGGQDVVQVAAEMGETCLMYKPLHTSSGAGQLRINTQEGRRCHGALATLERLVREAPQGQRLGVLEGVVQVAKEWTLLALQTPAGLSLSCPIAHRQLRGDWVESWFDRDPEPHHLELARCIAHTVCPALGGHGLFALEYFITSQGDLLLNEVAARPHDTGFVTLALGDHDQFTLCLRAALGEPVSWPASTPEAAARAIRSPAHHQAPSLLATRDVSGARVIDFGKPVATPGRRLGAVVAQGPGARGVALAQSMAVSLRGAKHQG